MYFNKVSETHTHTHMSAFGLCAFVKPKKNDKKNYKNKSQYELRDYVVNMS